MSMKVDLLIPLIPQISPILYLLKLAIRVVYKVYGNHNCGYNALSLPLVEQLAELRSQYWWTNIAL